MVACVAASISSVTGLGSVEDAKLATENFESYARPALQNALREDFLQAYVMAAVEMAPGGDDSSLAAPLLQGGGVDTNSAASPASKSVADVSVERRVAYVEPMQKGLHDLHASIHSPPTAPCKRPMKESEDALVDILVHIQNVTEVVTELDNANDTSRELNTKSNENRDEYLQVPAAIGSDVTAKRCDDAGDTELVSVVSDEMGGADENSTTASVIAGTSVNMIADGRADVSKDTAHGDATPPESVEAIQRNGSSADDDDRVEISEIGNKRVAHCEREAIGVPEHSHPTGDGNEVPEEKWGSPICAFAMNGSESELMARSDIFQTLVEGKINGVHLDSRMVDVHHVDPALKIEVSSSEASNIDVVHKVENAAMISRSFSFTGLNHVAFCVEKLERSLDFYCGLLGLKTNTDRPDLPYRGAWLFLGAEGIHLMEVANPDPVSGRPAHGGFDRHACLNCKNVEGVRLALEKAEIPYQPSIVPSLFTRDPDGNGLEFIEVDS